MEKEVLIIGRMPVRRIKQKNLKECECKDKYKRPLLFFLSRLSAENRCKGCETNSCNFKDMTGNNWLTFADKEEVTVQSVIGCPDLKMIINNKLPNEDSSFIAKVFKIDLSDQINIYIADEFPYQEDDLSKQFYIDALLDTIGYPFKNEDGKTLCVLSHDNDFNKTQGGFVSNDDILCYDDNMMNSLFSLKQSPNDIVYCFQNDPNDICYQQIEKMLEGKGFEFLDSLIGTHDSFKKFTKISEEVANIFK